MNRVIWIALAGLLLGSCQTEQITPPKSTGYRLARMIVKIPDGTIREDHTYSYDSQNRLIRSKDLDGADYRVVSQFFYDDVTGLLTRKMESLTDGITSKLTTYVMHYSGGIPDSAVITHQGQITAQLTCVFRLENGKVVSARTKGTDIVDSVVYEGNNIVKRFQTATSKEVYVFGSRRGVGTFNFKWFLSDITPLQFDNEVTSYTHDDPDVHNISLSYSNYVYNAAGYPTSCKVYNAKEGGLIWTAEFLYEPAE